MPKLLPRIDPWSCVKSFGAMVVTGPNTSRGGCGGAPAGWTTGYVCSSESTGLRTWNCSTSRYRFATAARQTRMVSGSSRLPIWLKYQVLSSSSYGARAGPLVGREGERRSLVQGTGGDAADEREGSEDRNEAGHRGNATSVLARSPIDSTDGKRLAAVVSDE